MRVYGIRRTFSAVVLTAVLVFGAAGMDTALATSGGEGIGDATSVTLPLNITGSLDATTSDSRDVFQFTLAAGQTLSASVIASTSVPNTDFDLLLLRPGTATIDDLTLNSSVAMWGDGALRESFTFMAADAGTYYLDVHAFSGAGEYTLAAQIVPAVPYQFTSILVPKRAKKGLRTLVSAVVSPGYNGYYSPVWFHFYRYEGGKYRRKAEKVAVGVRYPHAGSMTLSCKYRFAKKGKWRVRAEFWDEAHTKSMYSKYKYITIK